MTGLAESNGSLPPGLWLTSPAWYRVAGRPSCRREKKRRRDSNTSWAVETMFIASYVLGYTHVAVQLKSIATILTITTVNITFATITLPSQTAIKAGSSHINRNRRNSSLDAPTPSSNWLHGWTAALQLDRLVHVSSNSGGSTGATENARPENAGLENDGQRFSKLWAKLRGLKNAGLENDGQNFSQLWAKLRGLENDGPC